MDRLGSFSGEFWTHFLMVAATSRWPRGAPLGPIGTPGSKNIYDFIDTNFKWFFQRSESSQNRVQRCDRRWKFENFENFYFLVFRFPWSILHIHLCLWPIRSARVGSPLAFYAFYFVTPSGGHFKRFSVNGLPNKMTATEVKVQYTSKNENWGVHARP